MDKRITDCIERLGSSMDSLPPEVQEDVKLLIGAFDYMNEFYSSQLAFCRVSVKTLGVLLNKAIEEKPSEQLRDSEEL